MRAIRSRSTFLRNGLGRFSSSERSYSGGSLRSRMGTNDVRLFDALDDGRDRDFALPEAWTVLDEEADDADDADELDADVDFDDTY